MQVNRDTGPGKRERLIAAAAEVIYEKGAGAATIADIARAAGIPVGNVYYYFKTRNDIIAAVIDVHAHAIDSMLAAIDASHATPVGRLKALFGALTGEPGLVARYGCPRGSLGQELAKYSGEAADDGTPDASRLLRALIDWMQQQFAAMGRPDARDLAVQATAAYQGTTLLTCALRDPSLLESESRRVSDWIDSLASGAKAMRER